MNLIPICEVPSRSTGPNGSLWRLRDLDRPPKGWSVIEGVSEGRLRVLFADFDKLPVPAETSRSEAEAQAIGVVAEDEFATRQFAFSRGMATTAIHATHVDGSALGRVYADSAFRGRPVEAHRLGRLTVSGFSATVDTGAVLLRITFSDGRSLDGGDRRISEIEEGNRAFLHSL